MCNTNGRAAVGIILVIIGLYFLADNIFYIPFQLRHYLFSWPALLILVGIILLINSKDSGAGIVLILIGGTILAFRFFGVPFSELIREYWPVILIIFGLYILLKPSRRYPSHNINTDFTNDYSKKNYSNYNFQTSNQDYINEAAVFSGSEKRIVSGNFAGGKLTAVFGGIDLDLRDAKLAPGKQVIDIMAIFGGIDIIVPKDMRVIMSVTSIFGAFDDDRRKDPTEKYDETRALEIRGVVIFGGGDLKN
ncbi:MAG: hypothetical protein JW995_05050 [Melioribacteraceae bacterium]|nr:hypothetical protein [Melioribacteraceae bacterium]